MCHITFLHPDLGIGGAERLVVDAALGLKRKGHLVTMVTTHHDPNHCFEETTNGDLSVVVVGDWIPRSLFGRFYALMAYIRMVYAAFFVIFSDLKPDIVICDLVSVAVPILKFKISNVIFYCHYPDQLLSRPGGILKQIYRIPLDWLEEISIRKASKVFVNSQFTATVFKSTFKKINTIPDILYPSLNTQFFDSVKDDAVCDSIKQEVTENNLVFLSINRFERKKNISLAIKAFHELKHMVSNDNWECARLIIAGGYDTRVTENVEHYEELIELTKSLNLNDKVILLKSPNDSEKVFLVKLCICLLYTPSNEHFGIVPVEAMYLKKPVIAVNSGGPTESIVDGETGYLCEPTATAFARKMCKFVSDKDLAKKFGACGRKRVIEKFSFEEFSAKLDEAITNLINKKTD